MVEGQKMIIGVDEVGVGSIAGPVIAGACAWNLGQIELEWGQKKKTMLLNDSKKLIPAKRKIFNQYIWIHSKCAIGQASIEEINKFNIHGASLIAMTRAVENLLAALPNEEFEIIVDGMYLIPGIKIKQTAIVKADTMVPAVMAASIIAKVYRDNLMDQYHKQYPKYGFNSNKGYQSKQHIQAIKDYGLTPLHRNFERFLEKIGVKYESKDQN